MYYDNVSDCSLRADDFELFTHCVSVNTATQVLYSLHEFRYVDYALDIANSDFSDDDDDDACSAKEPQVMTCELTTESVATCTAVPITAPQTFCPEMCTIDAPAFTTATVATVQIEPIVQPAEIHVDSLNSGRQIFAKLELTTKRRKIGAKLKLDTGSEGNLLPIDVYCHLVPNATVESLTPSNTVLRAYNDGRICHFGIARLHVTNPKTYRRQMCDFFVTKSGMTPLIGLDAVERLGLIEIRCDVVYINSVQTTFSPPATPSSPTKPPDKAPPTSGIDQFFMPTLTVAQDKQASQDFKRKMVSKYPDVFTGIGTLPGTVHLELVDDYTPHQTAVRRIPISLQEPVRQEVEKMLNDGIIRRVDDSEHTEFCNSFVIVRCPNGQVRL